MAIASQMLYGFESLLNVGWTINELTYHKRWTPMMQIKEEFYDVIIRELYGNVEVNEEITTLTSTLKSLIMEIRTRTLTKILKNPSYRRIVF